MLVVGVSGVFERDLAGLIGLFLLSDISEKPFCVELKLFLFRLVRKEKYYRVLRLPFLLY